MTTIHGNSPDYFRRKRDAAKTALERMYWGIRLKRSLKLEEQLKARAKTAAKLAQRESNLNSFANLKAPEIELESMHPNGCIVRWKKPEGWEPDNYVVLVKDAPTGDWRSVASSNITWETRSQVLTKSYLAWGKYKEPYYIAVAAVKDGVGRKESETMVYPPQTPIEPVEEPETQRVVNPFESREESILFSLRTYNGRRTRKGRPYIGDFREHCVLYPKVKYSEMRRLWKQLENAPTGEEKWR